MQKNDEDYFLDKKLLNTLQQSNQLQSQLKVFLYKDQEIIAASKVHNAAAAPTTPTLSSGINPPESTVATTQSTRQPRKTKQQLNREKKVVSDHELQDYLFFILLFFQQNETPVVNQLRNFLGDSVNFFIIENFSRIRLKAFKQIQQAKLSKLKL
jgi:hypothetical protein